MPNPNPKVPPKEVRLRALGVEPLAPGEGSRKMTVRGPLETLEVLGRLSAKERGQVVQAGLRALGLWPKEAEDEEAQAGQ